MSNSQEHGRSYALAALSSGFGIVATLGSGILLARLLSLEDRGLVALVIYWVTFAASIGSLSLHEAFILRSSQAKSSIRERLPSTLVVAAALLFATLLLTVGVSTLFSEQFGDLDMWIVIVFFSLYLFVRSLNMILVAVEQASLQFGRLALEQMLLPLFYATMLIAAGLTGHLTVAVVLAIFLISRTPVLLIRFWRYKNMMVGPVVPDEMRAVANIGTRFHSTALVRSVADQADKILISIQWNTGAIANFAVGFSAAGAAYGVVGQALGLISLPTASKVPKEEVADHFTRSVRVTSILLVAIMIPIAALAPILVPLVFGERYESAVLYTQVLTVTLLPVPLIGLADAILRGRGHTDAAMRLHATTLLLFVIGWIATGYSEIVALGLGLAISRLGALLYTILRLRDEFQTVRVTDCIFWRGEDFRLISDTMRKFVSFRTRTNG